MRPVCLVTGAGGRLGRALCRALLDRYDVVATYRHTHPDVPSQLRRRVGVEGATYSGERGVHCIEADLSKREDIRRLVDTAIARFGRIDVLINSAADTLFHGRLIELWQAGDGAESQLQLNCIAPVRLISAVYEQCWKYEPGENDRWNRAVINVSSMSGLQAYAAVGQGYYAASKAALNMLTLYLSLELAPYSVRVNAICPGSFTDEPSTHRVVEAIQRLMEDRSSGMIISDF